MRWRNRGPAYRPGGSTSAAAHVTADCTARAILQASTRIRYPEHAASAHWRRRPEPNRFHRSPDRAATHRRDRHRHTSRWPSEYHFASWTTLAPNNKISGGRLLSSRTPPSANRAAAILRRCAMSVGKTSTQLRAFYRCPAVRVGKAKAITATAANLPSWSTACCPATSSITTPAQPLTINSTGSANSSHCASAPSSSASTSSIALPVKCS